MEKHLRENLNANFASSVSFTLLKYGVGKEDIWVNPLQKGVAEVRLRNTDVELDGVKNILQEEDFKIYPTFKGLLVTR